MRTSRFFVLATLAAMGTLLGCGGLIDGPSDNATSQPLTPLQQAARDALANAVFAPVGPAPELDGNVGMSGRVNVIAISPSYDGAGTAAMFLGTAGGGIWRSTDFTSAAPTWTPLTDKL